MQKLSIKITGMTCVSCANSAQTALNALNGVEATVNFASSSANIILDEKINNLKNIEKAINKLGFKISNGEEKPKTKQLILAILFTIPLFLISMLPMMFNIDINISAKTMVMIQLILTIPVMIIGRKFYVSGFRNILRPNMDTLIAIGTSAAFLYSVYSTYTVFMGNEHNIHNLYFESTAVIITLVLLGKYLESNAIKKTGLEVEKLLNLTPKTAIVIRNDIEMEINTSEIISGDIILIKPGQSLPADGEIISGIASIDESMLTGESLPLDKTIKDKVFAGTINTSGSITYIATNTSENTVLASIARLVEEAAGSKAPIAKLADKISRIFVPIVIFLAIISFIFWIFNGQSFQFALTIFISVLVISCPCALGLATPISIIVGTGRAASLNILFKNATSLENAHKTTAILIDKTGTITEGHPIVSDIFVENFINENDLLQIVASAEKSSEHPLARAICENAISKNIEFLEYLDFKSEIGFGIECKIDNKIIKVGKKDFIKSANLDLSSDGKTIIYVSIDDIYAGAIALSDKIKDSSIIAIKELNDMGIKTIMLTGDNENSAKVMAQKCGITDVYANVLPHEKAEKVKFLQSSGNFVCMVGDGVNDSPALASSDIGIAIGSGSDIALESGDIILTRNNLQDVATAIKLSSVTIKVIKQNLFWAFAYNIIGIPIAMGCLYFFGEMLLDPMLAAAAMSLSSVTVVLNALRLNLIKIK